MLCGGPETSLAGAVRSDRIRGRVASTATPALRGGALRHTGALQRTGPLFRYPRLLRVGGLIPNPVVCLANGKQERLDANDRFFAQNLTAYTAFRQTFSG